MNIKYYKENLKDNKTYLLFHTLNDFTDIKTKNKTIQIINLFNIKKYYLKIQTTSYNFSKRLQTFSQVIEHYKKNNVFTILCEIQNDLSEIINLIDINETSIEIFDFIEDIKPNLSEINKLNFKVYIYLSDNDGPSIIINKNYYDINNVLNLINAILK